MASFLPRTYIILGVHRSGTSFLAKTLKDVGIPLKGGPAHYEDIDFIKLNMKIIQEAGGIWKNPPDRESLLKSGENHKEEIQALLSAKRQDMWGWKDPRQALTIESYLPYLEDDVYLICIFRKPELVGASLKRLGQTSQGENMAKEYDRRIIKAIERFVGI